jgi:hypothetical protein
LGADKSLKVVKAAREVGCKKIVVTHPFFVALFFSVEQVKEAVSLGVMIESSAWQRHEPPVQTNSTGILHRNDTSA